jgi:hypothetical protein
MVRRTLCWREMDSNFRFRARSERRAAVQKTLGVARQPFDQAQLVIEFRARRRIAVRQIQASDEQAADGRLDVAAMRKSDRPAGCGGSPPARRRGRGSLHRST